MCGWWRGHNIPENRVARWREAVTKSLLALGSAPVSIDARESSSAFVLRDPVMCAAVTCPPVEETGGPLRLSEIADALGVPVVILTYENRNDVGRFATFGVELDIDRAGMATAFGAQCGRGATVVPNLAVHPELSHWADQLVKRGLKFMVGVPLYDGDGERSGSISVVAAQKDVAGHGIQVHLLKELGNAFLMQKG